MTSLKSTFEFFSFEGLVLKNLTYSAIESNENIQSAFLKVINMP